MLAPETVEAVKAVSDIIPIIGEYVSLKKRGRSFTGLCPFHSEKTPSFHVSQEKRFWHCFGCQESGDLIAFITKIEAVGFVDAIRIIAEKCQIPILETDHNNAPTQSTSHRSILKVAKQFFIQCLAENAASRNYFAERGILPKSISKFELGWCPPGTHLFDYLKSANFSETDIEESGLVVKSDQGIWLSRFRNRIIFPIHDHRGNPVGFGGRIIDASSQAKYINSPESPTFLKRKTLWGLDKAKSTIATVGHILIMEGYMDVIMAHQCGFQQSVATMGTALTFEHIQSIKRVTDTVYLMMDSDKAGIQAMEKSYMLLADHAIKVWIIPNSQKDPADYLIAHSAPDFQKLLNHPRHFVEFSMATEIQKRDVSETGAPSAILTKLMPLIQVEPDSIVRDQLIDTISTTIGIRKELMVDMAQKNIYNSSVPKFRQQKSKLDRLLQAERILIYWAAIDLDVRRKILEIMTVPDFTDPSHQEIMTVINATDLLHIGILNKIQNESARKLFGHILMQGETEKYANHPNQWQDCINWLINHQKHNEIAELKNKIREIENDSTQDELLQSLMTELGKLLHNS